VNTAQVTQRNANIQPVANAFKSQYMLEAQISCQLLQIQTLLHFPFTHEPRERPAPKKQSSFSKLGQAAH